jgi:hypothetical protein
MDFVRVLRSHGVRVQNRTTGLVCCVTCGHNWTIEAPARRQLREPFWQCPQGCNAKR